MIQVNKDAWSEGQIRSKLWLCEQLEPIAGRLLARPAVIWVLGGWYGLASFLFLSRGNLPIRQIRSFDQDADAVRVADLVNNCWEIQEWKFKAFQHDCNLLSFEAGPFGDAPDLVINTSCEHFQEMMWWEKIPRGTLVALQSTDQLNPDHYRRVASLAEMTSMYPGWSEVLYQGQLSFAYPDWGFNRYMIIGRR